ncbi:AMP-binding enzyme domain-containing protein isoform 2 [Cladophialophora immunda]|nr:AMP-binding enzyme domain-containing protein isoform 2 [Cladophialophora immunda]
MFKSPYSIDIPLIDVNTFVFQSGSKASREAPQYFDADTPAKCFSLAQGEIYSKRVALGLQQLGLKADERLLLYSNNRLFFPVVIWGTIAAGCIFSAASPSASASELAYQLRDSGAALLLTGPDGIAVALNAASEAGLSRNRVLVFHDPDEDLSSYNLHGLNSWTNIWASEDAVRHWSWKRLATIEEVDGKTAIINYSSGTTGLPKGVQISHYNLVSNSVQLLFKRALVGSTPRARARKERLDVSGERWLAPLPMYHAYGQTYYGINAAYLDAYRITFMTGVPTVIAMLCKQDAPERYNLKSLEQVVSGSAPLDPKLGRLLAKLYLRPGVQVKQGWGMTECTCSATGFSPDEEDDGRSIGWLNPNCAAKIVPVDEELSSSTASGQKTGEIWVSGPNIMKGYWNKPEATAQTIVQEDGHRWLRTGDIGYCDDQGKFYIVDRLKASLQHTEPAKLGMSFFCLLIRQELIKIKGLQVSPTELELTLLNHPEVTDAAVVGAIINGEEYVRAFVVRKSDTLTAKELFEMIQKNFAPHKWLTGGIYFIDAIPRTGSGKIMRRNLPQVPSPRPLKL